MERLFETSSKDGFAIVYELKNGPQNLIQKQLCSCSEHKTTNHFTQASSTQNLKNFSKRSNISNFVAKSLILFYQASFSHFLGGRCRYYPSCSHYAIEAYEKFSFFSASLLVLKRLGSCHPFSRKAFYDPVPNSYQEMSIP